ncbi:TrbL/VirB6 plasmid conjugal transfer protein [Caballeronia calidae]|uniref:TrbL/VirB6 plasmid conjugal transfer protein n=1 Tax=Caballeronia calidae TaxID=1777139 RepID=A0A158EEE2_9BURK|nr:type IV secretion system protein [Caballeronia calidae]SAL05218.1 TrbL/VirB6 plasmid conjugal transfer protein [Caballeronia calidae]
MGDNPVFGFIQLISDAVTQSAATLVATHYPLLAAKVMPIAILMGMLWLAAKVVRVHSGRDPADVWPLVRMMLTMMFIFSGLNWGGLGGKIFTMFSELRDNTVSIFMGGMTTLQYVQTVCGKVGVLADSMMSQSVLNIGIVLIGVGLTLLNALLALVVLTLNVASIMGLGITAVLGPLFLPLLFWDATRGYGMNWFSAMFKFALVGILLGITVVFSFGAVTNLMGTLAPTTAQKTADAVGAIVVEGFLLLFVALGVRPLASALASSGAAGGGVAEMAAGFAISQILQKLTGSGKSSGGGGNGNGGNASSDSPGGGARAQLQEPPSGVGQPGGSGGGGGSGDAHGSQSAMNSEAPRW